MKDRILRLIEDSGVSFCNPPVSRETDEAKEQLAEYLAENIDDLIVGEIDENLCDDWDD